MKPYIVDHCVNSVCIRSYSGPHFSRIFTHPDFRIQSEFGKMQGNARTAPNTNTFYAVDLIENIRKSGE